MIFYFRGTLCKRNEPSVYYEGVGKGVDMTQDDWDNSNIQLGFNTCTGRKRDGQYAHVLSPVNNDVIIIDTSQVDMPGEEIRAPHPSTARVLREYKDHVYEKPP